MPMPRDVMYLSPDQFDKLVELLTPGYECAKLMLADRQAYSTPPDDTPSADATGGEGQSQTAANQESA